MTTLEMKFHNEMLDIYHRAKKELRDNATRFLQLLSERGGLSAAKQLIVVDGGTYGFINTPNLTPRSGGQRFRLRSLDSVYTRAQS